MCLRIPMCLLNSVCDSSAAWWEIATQHSKAKSTAADGVKKKNQILIVGFRKVVWHCHQVIVKEQSKGLNASYQGCLCNLLCGCRISIQPSRSQSWLLIKGQDHRINLVEASPPFVTFKQLFVDKIEKKTALYGVFTLIN